MKQTAARPLLILLTLTAIGVLAVVVWAASQRSSSPGVHIGRAVSITRPHASTYTVGAAFRHYATAVASRYCGQPSSGVAWQGNVAEQHYAPDCTLRARYRILTPTPAPVSPTAQPTVIRSTPTVAPAQPTPTPNTASPTAFLLSLINGHRSAAGVPPLALSDVQSMGTATCVGSIGHSQAMQQSGSIWHVNPAYVAASFPNNICLSGFTMGQNVGNAGEPELSAIQSIDAMMMNETPHTPTGCAALPAGQTNHACNLISPHYTQLGIGLVYVNGITWLTEDLIG